MAEPSARHDVSRRVASGWPAFVAPVAFASALVVLRSLVFIAYEQASFDSDQAIIGLMAKHLAEGRAFPLFFYGQTYMLGVDAWAAAPLFAVAGASVATLHISTLLWNVVAVGLLVVGLTRWGGLSPWRAAVATVPFALAAPVAAAELIQADGNIGVFVYVPLLWFLRARPLWFGTVLAIGFLNREFTIYALPAIAIAELATGVLTDPRRLRRWLVAAVVAAGVWQTVQALKPHADLMGPGSRGQFSNAVAGSQIGNLAERVSFAVAEYPQRAVAMFGHNLPRLYGMTGDADAVGVASRAHTAALFTGLLVVLALAVLNGISHGFGESAFGWYLLAVGLAAAGGHVATRPVGGIVDRYVLLALLAPVGAVAVVLANTTARWQRILAIAFTLAVGLSSAIDHAEFARAYWRSPPDDMRRLVDGLAAKGITVAEAGYWRSYKATFLAHERVIVASTDVVRVQEYRQRANAAGASLVHIQEQPCSVAGEALGPWYLCR